MPTIRFNSSTGSDTAASGSAGAIAASGTAASYSGSVVTLDGSPDLSGFNAADDVLWLNTSTGRKFFDLSAADNSAKTVTTVNAPLGTASGLSWAIGGKRQYCFSATSKVLVDNGGSTGDAKAGWVLRMESGHAETIAATVDLRNLGDASTGVVTIEGDPAAGTRPVLTFTNNGNAFVGRTNPLTILQHFKMVNTNATKTASVAFNAGSNGGFFIYDVRIGDSTNPFWKGATGGAATSFTLLDCLVDSCTSHGINTNDRMTVSNCRIANCGGDGIYQSGTQQPPTLKNLLIEGCSGYGIRIETSGGTVIGSLEIIGCVIEGNTSGGIYLNGTTIRLWTLATITNNLITNNGGYGLSAASGGELYQVVYGSTIDRNAYYGNTSGELLNLTPGSGSITLTADPYDDAASGDYNLNTTAGGGQTLRDSTYTLP